MSELPENLKYAASHEWVSNEGENIALVGITDHAQDALGDVVFVELPEVGTEVSAGEEVAVVESVKASSDIYAPVSGKIIAVNELLDEAPETVNDSPYADAWFFKIEMSDSAELNDLLSSDDYAAQLD